MFGLIEDIIQDPLTFGIPFLLALLFSLSVHESAHALIAYRLGDPTGKMLGRISLNPLRHLEVFGSLMFLFVGFGWAKPVPVNPANLRNDPRLGMALVSGAGPISNLALAIISAFILVGTRAFDVELPDAAGNLLQMLVYMNVLLAIFNLIPLAPLDGFAVLLGILPRQMAINFSRLREWGPGILFALIGLSWITASWGTPINVFAYLGRVVQFVVGHLYVFVGRFF